MWPLCRCRSSGGLAGAVDTGAHHRNITVNVQLSAWSYDMIAFQIGSSTVFQSAEAVCSCKLNIYWKFISLKWRLLSHRETLFQAWTETLAQTLLPRRFRIEMSFTRLRRMANWNQISLHTEENALRSKSGECFHAEERRNKIKKSRFLDISMRPRSCAHQYYWYYQVDTYNAIERLV